ncbi:MAG: L,D-transpeptidase family protein [Atopobiaceae bacterium]|nr:L,D-transpeptidase family protein [Atopobiaceae bacterium]
MRDWKRGLVLLALSMTVGASCLPALAAETEDALPEEVVARQLADPAGASTVTSEEHGDAPKEEPVQEPEGQAEGVADESGASQVAAADLTAVVEPQVQDGWNVEEGFYVYYRAGVRQSGWLIVDVTPQGERGGLERYWLDDEGHLATGRLVSPDEAGYWAYAMGTGKIARGYHRSSEGLVYLADNDGRLAGPGWVVSNAYGQGLQRYFVDFDAHACVPGYSSDGYAHYTRAEGFVVRGKLATAEGLYLANNDGRIYEGGWVVSSEFGDGIQRYYVNPATHTCVEGYSADGWPHYTRPEGYVARGRYRAANGLVYLANNDGRLEADGWVVSSAYGDGIQRYYVEPGRHACVPGYAEGGWPHYTRPEGYVARGAYKAANGHVYLANNDGRLATGGWVVSSAYGQGLQRYWVDASAHACIPGYSEEGWAHYTRPEGYVVRGLYTSGSTIWLANNDGLLANGGKGGWLVTSAFGQGLQRYYIDGGTHGIPAGLNHDGSWWFYTRPEGYVVRGVYRSGNDIYLADNDGRLPSQTSNGWLVTSAYGQGLQRYYIYGVTHAARFGYSTDGWPHFTTEHAYVLRGTLQYGGGVLLADIDGRLATSTGWLDSSAYGDGARRYYLEACCTGGVIGARTGLFMIGSNKYYGYPNKGFIAQNTDVTINGIPYHADAAGVLTAKYPQSIVSMALRANNYSSGTGWLIMVDRSATKVAIFRGSRGSWTLNRWFDCTVGRANAPTVSGTFSIGSRGYSFGESKGYSAYYWTQFYSDYLFHSVLYYPYTRNIQDGRLNGHLSAGCIRLQIDNAKWIYDNIPSGTTVNIV